MSAEASKVAAAVAPAVKEEPKSFARRDRLRDIEKEVQASSRCLARNFAGSAERLFWAV
jgi:hypothetical protein